MNRIRYGWMLALLLAGGVLLTGCSSGDAEGAENLAPKVQNPLTDAVKVLNSDLEGLDFRELEPLGDAVNQQTRSLSDDVSEEVCKLLSQLLATLQGDVNANLSGGRRFTYQTMNDALSISFDLAGSLAINSESEASFLDKHTECEGEVTFTTKDGISYKIVGMTEKDVYIKSWNINVDKASELMVYKDGELLLKLTSSLENDRPVWLPLFIRGNTFVGELTYLDYIVTMGYDRQSAHQRNITLEYRKSDSELPLIEMTTQLEDDADILKLIKHDVNVEADFTVKALYGLFQFTGHCRNMNYLVLKGKEVVLCLENGTADEGSCRQIADEFNEYLTMKFCLDGMELGDLVMDVQFVAEENCWKPVLMLDLPQMGGRYAVSDILKSLGVDLSDLLSNMSI